MTLNAPHLLHVVRGEVDARLRNLRMLGDWGGEGGEGKGGGAIEHDDSVSAGLPHCCVHKRVYTAHRGTGNVHDH